MLSVSLLRGLNFDPRTLDPREEIKTSFDKTYADTATVPAGPSVGMCTPDGQYMWDGASWKRKVSGAVCTGTYSAPATVTSPITYSCSPDGQEFYYDSATNQWKFTGRACTPPGSPTEPPPVARPPGSTSTGGGGVTVTPALVFNLGPWTIPVPRPGNSYSWILDDYSKLPPEIAELIGKQLMTPIQSGWKTPFQVGYWKGEPQTSWTGDHLGPDPGQTVSHTYPDGRTQTIVWPAAASWGAYMTWRAWADRLGIWGQIVDAGYFGGLGDPTLCGDRSEYACSTSGSTADKISPVAKFKHPETDEDWGLWIEVRPIGPVIAPISNTMSDGSEPPAPYPMRSITLRFTVQKIPTDPWYKPILQVLFYIPAKVFDVAIATVQEIVNIACTDLTGALKAATAAGPEAVAAVSAAAALCPRTPPDTPLPEETKVNETTGKKALPWGWIIAGLAAVGGLTAFVLIPPKKKPALKPA